MSAQIDLLNDDQQNICDGIQKGALFERIFEWTDDDGNPTDITGFRFRMGVLDKNTGNNITTLNSSNPIDDSNNEIRAVGPTTDGVFKLFLTGAQTLVLAVSKQARYDIYYDAGSGWIPLWFGLIDISQPKTDLST